MSAHYCIYADKYCGLDIDEAYKQGWNDAINEIKNKLNEKPKCNHYDAYNELMYQSIKNKYIYDILNELWSGNE